MNILQLPIQQSVQLLLLVLSQLQAIEQIPLIFQGPALTLCGVVKQLLLQEHQSLLRMQSSTHTSPTGSVEQQRI